VNSAPRPFREHPAVFLLGHYPDLTRHDDEVEDRRSDVLDPVALLVRHWTRLAPPALSPAAMQNPASRQLSMVAAQPPDLGDQTRNVLTILGDEVSVLIPALVIEIHVSRLLHKGRRDDLAVLEFGPTFTLARVWTCADGREAHGMVVIQMPNVPRPGTSHPNPVFDGR